MPNFVPIRPAVWISIEKTHTDIALYVLDGYGNFWATIGKMDYYFQHLVTLTESFTFFRVAHSSSSSATSSSTLSAHLASFRRYFDIEHTLTIPYHVLSGNISSTDYIVVGVSTGPDAIEKIVHYADSSALIG